MSPQTEVKAKEMKSIPYASGVGSLMYAMVCCRPDLAHAVSQVSRFMANPGKEHWRALKGVFRYLVGTVGVGICYEQEGRKEKNSNMTKKNQSRMIGFVDADYGGDMDTHRSTTGYVFCLNGGPVSWRSSLQPITALSTTEAEYIGITEAAKKALWYHRIRELVEERKVELAKVHTKENLADALIKILPRDGFLRCVTLMGLMDQEKLAKALEC
ncbi:secreted RxLR effector protein 161-like [Phoenix dactylifera]|uniref:Secreted RxLR effector protein 161-like n=1 Tax=Phoenix dactylifera TaxID=42345 RepID=A0A8B8ZKH3_PHODC|nr:secreted RxLR effector protein 161-like [Phoenix dactylifera]